ncbi:MAG TPA: transporter associated domain-containing protein [Nevskiales bacterium]|nr:transporter associated domain-containing protein [Nevskiales bacterium]
MSKSKEPARTPGRKGLQGWLRKQARQLVGAPQSREEILEWLREGRQAALLDAEAYGMIQGVLQVSQTQVRDIMVPRSQMVVVERDASPAELLREVIQSGHSRYPVIGDNRDEVVGILLAKDLLRLALDQEHLTPESRFDIREVIRPAVVVPESKRLNVLLKEFRANRNHIAIVIDEYGGVSGLVTIEDVLEQIVGEIDDEHDEEEGAFILRQDRERYLVRALTPIAEFNRYFGVQFSDEEFDTIGGLVAHHFGHLPRRGESVTLDCFQFNVQRADSRRVHLFQVTVLPDRGPSAA